MYTTDRHEARFQGVMEWKAKRNRIHEAARESLAMTEIEKYNYNKDLLIAFSNRENLCMFECRKRASNFNIYI